MPATLTKGATVRVRRGNTVDTDRVTGGDVKGCRGEVIHAPALMAGPDGKKEQRVLVALDDAPAGAGFVSVPVENVETVGRFDGVRKLFGGISFRSDGSVVR